MGYAFLKAVAAILWAISIAINTIYGGTRALAEVRCFYPKPGNTVSVLQQMYLTRINNFSPNFTGWDFDYLWLTGAAAGSGELWEYYNNGTWNPKLNDSVIYKFEKNKKYYELRASIKDSQIDIPIYYSLDIDESNADFPAISEYKPYNASRTYLSASYIVRARDCKVGDSFNYIFIAIAASLFSFPILCVLLYFLPKIGYKSVVIFKSVMFYIPLTGWYKLRYFCNEMTNEPVVFTRGEINVKLFPIDFKGELQSLNSIGGAISLDRLSTNSYQVLVDKNLVHFKDHDSGEYLEYDLITDQESETFKLYLGLVSTSPKYICLNQEGDHHLTMREVLNNINGDGSQRKGFWGLGKEKPRMKIAYVLAGSTKTAYGESDWFTKDNTLYTTLVNSFKMTELQASCLVTHNRYFFNKTDGNDSAALMVASSKLEYKNKPETISVSQWNYYLSDVKRLFIIFSSKVLPIKSKMGPSPAFNKYMSCDTNPKYTNIKNKEIKTSVVLCDDQRPGEILNSFMAVIHKKRDYIEKMKEDLVNLKLNAGYFMEDKNTKLLALDKKYFNYDLYEILSNTKNIREDMRYLYGIWERYLYCNLKSIYEIYRERTPCLKVESNRKFLKEYPGMKHFDEREKKFKRVKVSLEVVDTLRKRLDNYDIKEKMLNAYNILSEGWIMTLEDEPEHVDITVRFSSILDSLFYKKVSRGKKKKKQIITKKQNLRKESFINDVDLSKGFRDVVSIHGAFMDYRDWLTTMKSKKATFKTGGLKNRTYKRFSSGLKISNAVKKAKNQKNQKDMRGKARENNYESKESIMKEEIMSIYRGLVEEIISNG